MARQRQTARTPATAVAPPSNVAKAKDILGSLSKSKSPTKESDKSDKVKLDLPDNLKPAFIRYAGQKVALKLLEEVNGQEKAPLIDFAFNNWIDKLWAAKSRPATMEVEVRDGQSRVDSCGNYIVQARFTISVPKPKNDESGEELAIAAIAGALNATGMDKEEAEVAATKFVNTELDLSKKPNIDLDKWLRGREEGSGQHKIWVEATPEEQEMASRAVLKLQGDPNVVVTPDEMAKLIEYDYKPVVKPGFLERVAGYARTKEQLKVLLTFVKPTNFFSSVEFAKNSNPSEKIDRQVKQFRDLLGVNA